MMNSPSHKVSSDLVAACVNDAAFALYPELSTRGNQIFSPLGIYCVLRMLYEGARGETRRALSRWLDHESRSAAPADLRLLLDKLESLARLTDAEARQLEDTGRARRQFESGQGDGFLKDAVRARQQLEQSGQWDRLLDNMFGNATADDVRLHLSVASGIWIQKGYACNADFLETIHAMIAAEMATLDFAGHPSEACEAINAWVAELTHGRIGSMLSPDRVSPLTRAIVGNALYFKARWEEKFPNSKRGHFYLLDGTRVETQMMVGEFWGLNYVQQPDFWAVELPYYRRPISMVLLVPNSQGEDALAALERQMSSRWGQILDARAQRNTVILTMPQFKVHGSHSLGRLSSLGLNAIFAPGADFSGISDEPGFAVDEILHDAYISVDQYGTEAAAATLAATMGARLPREQVALTIDRPFIFLVLDKSSGVILFLGRVEKPE